MGRDGGGMEWTGMAGMAGMAAVWIWAGTAAVWEWAGTAAVWNGQEWQERRWYGMGRDGGGTDMDRNGRNGGRGKPIQDGRTAEGGKGAPDCRILTCNIDLTFGKHP